MSDSELLRRPVKTVNRCIQKHFEAWQNVGLADVMHDSKRIDKEKKKAGIATSNRLYLLHAQQLKKRDQKAQDKQKSDSGCVTVSESEPSTFMSDVVRKRSKLEQEKYELAQKGQEDPPNILAASKAMKVKDLHASTWMGSDFSSMFVKKKSKLEIEKEAFLRREREQQERNLIDSQKNQLDLVQKID